MTMDPEYEPVTLEMTERERRFLHELMDLLSMEYTSGVPELLEEHLGDEFDGQDGIQDLADSIFDKTRLERY